MKDLSDCERYSQLSINSPHRLPKVDRTSASGNPLDRSEFYLRRAAPSPNRLTEIELQISFSKERVESLQHCESSEDKANANLLSFE